MAEMFGNSFLTQYGSEPPSVWVAQIEMLQDHEIRSGLNDIAGSNLSFPPNLSQFISSCKKLQPSKAGYWGAPRIEDQRKSGRMPYREWLQREGKDHPLVK